MSDVKELEQSMGNIVSLLHEANEPAGGLAAKFGSFTTDSKAMEVLMRFASGSGLWKALNYAKAVGITISQWNKGAQEFRKQQSEMYGALSRQLKTEKDLAKLKNTSQNLYAVKNDTQNKLAMEALQAQKNAGIDLTNIQEHQLKLYEDMANVMEDDLYQGMKAMYGEEFARLKLLEDSTKALDEQVKKQSEINELMSNKDIERAMKLQAGKPLSPDAMRAAKEGQKRGLGKIKDDKFVEFGPIKKAFLKPIKKMQNNIGKIWKFAGGLSKMIWAYLKSGILIFKSAMIYLVLLLIGFMAAKKVYQWAKKRWGKFSGDFGTIKEKWANFMKYWETPIKPMLMTVWGNLKAFWTLLKDPKAGFWETLMALKDLLLSLFKVWVVIVLSLLKTIVFPLLGQLLVTIGEGAVRLGMWAVDKFKDKIDELAERFAFVKAYITYFKMGISLLKAVFWGIRGLFGKNKEEHRAKSKAEMANVTKYGASLAGQVVQGLHTGGTVTKSGAFIVGERGPELLHLPKGSAVTPNTGGNTINVHVNGRVGASDSELRDIARKVGAMINREINRTTNAGVRL